MRRGFRGGRRGEMRGRVSGAGKGGCSEAGGCQKIFPMRLFPIGPHSTAKYRFEPPKGIQ